LSITRFLRSGKIEVDNEERRWFSSSNQKPINENDYGE